MDFVQLGYDLRRQTFGATIAWYLQRLAGHSMFCSAWRNYSRRGCRRRSLTSKGFGSVEQKTGGRQVLPVQ